MPGSSGTPDIVQRGRQAFAEKKWTAAYEALSQAAVEAPLSAEDLERLAITAHLLYKRPESEEYWTRAHQAFVATGEVERAARCAYWLGFQLLVANEVARGGGWLGRAQRLLEEKQLDCVERGFLLLPGAVRSIFAGDYANAYTTFTEVARIAERFSNRDLNVLAWHGQGRVLIRQGEHQRGLALLDEVMVAITADECSPMMTGDIYCSVIEACHEVFDLRRAQEWTAALTRWCAAQPDLVPYRGQCLVRRAEIMQLHGSWPDAIREAERARERLLEPPPGQAAAGLAFYQLGELHRLRGEFAEAEGAYRQASQRGRKPHPGLALLRLAQGDTAAATAAIRRVLEEATDTTTRSRLLGAFIEIMLAAGDLAVAREAANELASIAANLDAPYLRAVSARATGAVLLAEGNARAASEALQLALTEWQLLEAPYETARTRLLIGLACRALGDSDSCLLDLEAAREAFRRLGAVSDLERLDRLSEVPADGAAGLSQREIQVLRLIATGKTNRLIAEELGISEKTVARHVANIFTKLDVSSRAAAAAFAYKHHLA